MSIQRKIKGTKRIVRKDDPDAMARYCCDPFRMLNGGMRATAAGRCGKISWRGMVPPGNAGGGSERASPMHPRRRLYCARSLLGLNGARDLLRHERPQLPGFEGSSREVSCQVPFDATRRLRRQAKKVIPQGSAGVVK